LTPRLLPLANEEGAGFEDPASGTISTKVSSLCGAPLRLRRDYVATEVKTTLEAAGYKIIISQPTPSAAA